MFYETPAEVNQKIAHCDFTPHENFIARMVLEFTYGNEILKSFNNNFFFGAILFGSFGIGKTSLAEKIALELGLDIACFFPASEGFKPLEWVIHSKDPSCVVLIDCTMDNFQPVMKIVRGCKRKDFMFFFEVSSNNINRSSNLQNIYQINYGTFPVYQMPEISPDQIEKLKKNFSEGIKISEEIYEHSSNLHIPVGTFVNSFQHAIMNSSMDSLKTKQE